MPGVTGVVETALYVDDLERSGQLFKKGGSTQPSPMHGGVIPPHDGCGTLHPAFAISPDESEPWKRHLEEKGVALESQVHCGDDHPQGDSLYLRDPDGHLIELVTPGCWPIY